MTYEIDIAGHAHDGLDDAGHLRLIIFEHIDEVVFEHLGMFLTVDDAFEEERIAVRIAAGEIIDICV